MEGQVSQCVILGFVVFYGLSTIMGYLISDSIYMICKRIGL